jgi:hypothetical protein
MALFKSKQIAAGRPAPTPMDVSSPVVVVGEFVTATGLTADDVIEMVAFPAGTVPVDVTVVTEDLDTGVSPAITLDVGLLSGDYADKGARTCGAEFLSASTVAQAGGVARAAVGAGLLLGYSNSDRSLGIKVGTAAATLATGKRIRMIATFAPVPHGVAATA